MVLYSIRKETQWRNWAEVYNVIWEIPDALSAVVDTAENWLYKPRVKFINSLKNFSYETKNYIVVCSFVRSNY